MCAGRIDPYLIIIPPILPTTNIIINGESFAATLNSNENVNKLPSVNGNFFFFVFLGFFLAKF